MKRYSLFIAVLVLIAANWFFLLRPHAPAPKASAEVVPAATSAASTNAEVARGKTAVDRLDLALELNAPNKTIRQDLRLLDSVFSVWQSNFLHTGNPVGENAEITAALTGRNALRVAFISPEHPAIDAHGQLCDRWGTPFFFHQLTGTKMEIRSAGPDKIRGTDDDAVFTP